MEPLTCENEEVQVEPAANGSYKVTMDLRPATTADFLARNAFLGTGVRRDAPGVPASLHPDQWAIIRIPYADSHSEFHGITNCIARRLGAMAQCHLLQGQPEEALRDLTLIHDLCRILESLPPASR